MVTSWLRGSWRVQSVAEVSPRALLYMGFVWSCLVCQRYAHNLLATRISELKVRVQEKFICALRGGAVRSVLEHRVPRRFFRKRRSLLHKACVALRCFVVRVASTSWPTAGCKQKKLLADIFNQSWSLHKRNVPYLALCMPDRVNPEGNKFTPVFGKRHAPKKSVHSDVLENLAPLRLIS